jgi:predicted enzyme related to lactoylglutathione lyase
MTRREWVFEGEAMHYQLEHVAVYCRDINESIKFYEKFFGGVPTAIRRGAAGYGFCFIKSLVRRPFN